MTHNDPNPISPQQLQSLRFILLEEKQWLENVTENNSHFGLSDSLRDQTGELSTNDNHPADLGSEMFERSKDIALNDNRERHFTQVTEALQRLDNGQYGICQSCGAPISFERLQAVPTTLFCKKHVPDIPDTEYRPVEEDILAPPFGRTSLDEKDKETEFDGEDAWQIVESWGSSNSPAMAEDPNISNNYNDMEIEADEQVGYVEAFESFLATDMYGQNVTLYRNRAYNEYLQNHEGEGLLELDSADDEDDIYTDLT
ncbi:transcriptional regulator, TraR/DksA family [Paenibacillus sp. 1_12]|uniref:TraR/DksA C4-type zinc finger protein n=1 Tax=Paenibacillus sp. 1_12 TaxID=1566278 RepID=UPI0008E64C6B|nr:TraR/DksA C4-type zinc finger protein [Paenibacillus sp. 1_12]SFK89996.1 transcriptional regulator, TraR/DksA family [Paenibacillus sp. 1_12]